MTLVLSLCSFLQIKSLTLQLLKTCPIHVADWAERKIILDNYMPEWIYAILKFIPVLQSTCISWCSQQAAVSLIWLLNLTSMLDNKKRNWKGKKKKTHVNIVLYYWPLTCTSMAWKAVSYSLPFGRAVQCS